MRFKKAILIPIYVYTNEEIELESIGLGDEDKAGWQKIELRAFWCIDSASKARGDSNKTLFYVNGETYYTLKTIKEFIDLINEHIQNHE